MEDELSQNRSAFAKPSVDPLDAALAELEQERTRETEPDPDKDETTSETTTADDEPEDDDLEDDDETVEANTPEDDVEDEDEDSLESQQRQKPAVKPSKPEAKKKQEQGEDSDDEEDLQLSRKQRGKLITELRQELEREQEQRRNLEESLKAQREADEKLAKEVDRALGTEEDYEKAMADGLAGDTKAAEKVRIWKANREFYKKLLDKSQRDTTAEFMSTYWESVSGLPGVTQEALSAPNLSTILKNLYDAGVASVKDSSTEQIEKLHAEIDTWKGRYKKLKLSAGGGKQSPLGTSGGSTASSKTFDWKKKYIDPKTGMLTDEADAIVAQHGFEALMDPSRLRKG